MSLPNLSLKGKVAIITGSSKGIGREIALVFAEAGADVVVSSRGLDSSLEEVAEEIRQLGRHPLVVAADIRKKPDVDKLVQRTVDEFGVIDILVNNAGVLFTAPFIEHSEEDWDRVMDTNQRYVSVLADGRQENDRTTTRQHHQSGFNERNRCKSG